MDTISLLTDLMKHMEWADWVVWRDVMESKKAEEDEKLRELLLHYHITQTAFLQIWSEEPLIIPDEKNFKTLEIIRESVKVYYIKLKDYYKDIGNYDLDGYLNIPWKKDAGERLGIIAKDATLAEGIIQVALHSSHHRGQVNKRIRELGGEPALTDFLAWVWMGKPETKWQ